jgi:hypothetical protein
MHMIMDTTMITEATMDTTMITEATMGMTMITGVDRVTPARGGRAS